MSEIPPSEPTPEPAAVDALSRTPVAGARATRGFPGSSIAPGLLGNFHYFLLRPEHRQQPTFPLPPNVTATTLVTRQGIRSRPEVMNLGLHLDHPALGVNDDDWVAVLAKETASSAPVAFHMAHRWMWSDEPAVALLAWSWVASVDTPGMPHTAGIALMLRMLHELAIRDYTKVIALPGGRSASCGIFRQLYTESFPLFAPVPGAVPDAFAAEFERWQQW